MRKWFIRSAGVVFVVTGIAKIMSALGSVKVLTISDPIIGIQLGHLLLIVGILELMVAGICFCGAYRLLATFLVAWLATNILAYRVELWAIGWHRPCACLGNLTDAIHVSPQLADNIMKGVLAYLLIGSYASLLWLWRQREKAETFPSGPPTPSPMS